MRRFALLALGAVSLAIGTGTASAYLAEGPDFVARAGSVASLTHADAQLGPVEIAIRDRLVHAGRDGDFHQKRDGAAVAEFYAQRNYQPVWTADGRFTDGARAVIERIARAGEDGLDPRAFRLPGLRLGLDRTAPPGRLARAEILLSLAVERYAREAYAGRIDPSSISEAIDIKPHLPDPIEVLAIVSSAEDPAAALAAYNPGHEGYLRLRQALADLRASDEEEPIVVPDGLTLRLGVSDERVAILRARLEITAATEEPELFDETVDEAVKAFQRAHSLGADGIVGPRTYAALNGPAADPEAEIIANMERWRWLPRDLGEFHVAVNIPEFTVRVNRAGETIHSTRVVVGKTVTPTPVFSDEIEHVIVNPYWNVPPSIARNELIPAMMANPGSVGGYEVFARGRRVDPWSVDWSQVNPRSIGFRQPPGAGNALGRIKFMFPNSHDVYLHDTPSKSLFQREVRAFSHGCIRVQEPFDFAAALLTLEPELTADGLRQLVGGRETQRDLTGHIPVHITYFTTWVNEAGDLVSGNDIYGYGKKVREALGL